MNKTLRLGSRGSPLAMVQAHFIQAKLAQLPFFQNAHCTIEIVPITTSGDWRPEHKDRSFLDMGGNKGLFTKEIEEALLSRTIDIAVHSMKDVASALPNGLTIAAILEREDPRDAFISTRYKDLMDMPAGTTVGTASLRRQSQILAVRPDLKVVPLRGNVETRLQKLANGQVDATILAVAGLSRLGYRDRITSIIDPSVMLPAGAQGALGLEIRSTDHDIANLLSSLNCSQTERAVRAEREMLRVLDGSCKTPIGAYATTVQTPNGPELRLDGVAALRDGTGVVRHQAQGPIADYMALGQKVGLLFKNELSAAYYAA